MISVRKLFWRLKGMRGFKRMDGVRRKKMRRQDKYGGIRRFGGPECRDWKN